MLGTPGRSGFAGPARGVQTREVRSELGLGEADLAALRAAGAIA
jgi:crotonobetainyl-CoA:carnitine CoA-transferase CaiB-like acyl-CoA transferase